jgi:hypothetical protein
MDANSNLKNSQKSEQKNFEDINIQLKDKKSLNHESESDWDFFWNNERMLSSKDMDILADKMKINRLPEMLFGNNIFYLVNSANNFVYEINPLEMLDMASYAWRQENIIKAENILEVGDSNFIYYTPSEVKVQYHKRWKEIKIEREDVKKLEPTEDWTFSSPYMGSIHYLDKHQIFDSISDQLKTPFDPFKNYSKFKIGKTELNLPVERLGQENPIIKYMEVNLFDDELNDNGVSMGNFR